jgi:hypothetical protein
VKIQEIFQSIRARGTAAAPTAGATDFQQVLAQKIATSAAASQTAATAPSSASHIPATLRLHGLELTESTINTLDSYIAALGNSGIKIHDLEPFVAALEEEVAALLEAKSQMPGNDPLAKMLDRVATVSYIETVKFRRGDYA